MKTQSVRYEVRVFAKYGVPTVLLDTFQSEKEAVKRAKIYSSKDAENKFFVKKITTERIWTSKKG